MGISQAISMFHLKVTLQVAAYAKRNSREDFTQPVSEIVSTRMKKYYRLGYFMHGLLILMIAFTIYLIVKVGKIVATGNYDKTKASNVYFRS